jgi:hypothetical protein
LLVLDCPALCWRAVAFFSSAGGDGVRKPPEPLGFTVDLSQRHHDIGASGGGAGSGLAHLVASRPAMLPRITLRSHLGKLGT